VSGSKVRLLLPSGRYPSRRVGGFAKFSARRGRLCVRIDGKNWQAGEAASFSKHHEQQPPEHQSARCEREEVEQAIAHGGNVVARWKRSITKSKWVVHVARNVGAIRELFLCGTHREDQLAVPVRVEGIAGQSLAAAGIERMAPHGAIRQPSCSAIPDETVFRSCCVLV
jgi:hypothetical protein